MRELRIDASNVWPAANEIDLLARELEYLALEMEHDRKKRIPVPES